MINQIFKKLTVVLLIFSSFNSEGQFFTYKAKKNKSFKKIKVDYRVSELNKSDSIYFDILKTKKINPTKSALVLIDVWQEKFLNPMVEKFINPLIDEASKLGINIIYAPSGAKQNKNLKIVENSITYYNFDVMDEFIYQNKIENIFYVGFDALLCVGDKPNGLFSFKQRNHESKMNYFVFEKGVMSFTKEMKQVALALYKKNNIGIISTEEINYKVTYPKKTERKINSQPIKKNYRGKEIVLVFRKKNSEDEQNKFIEKLKKTNTDYAEVIREKLIYKNKVISNSYDFVHLLMKNKIKNIYYSGYYLNNEVLWSKFGITNLYSKKRYSKISKLPEIYILKDQVYISKSPEIEPSIEKSIIINHYRKVKNISSEKLFIQK